MSQLVASGFYSFFIVIEVNRHWVYLCRDPFHVVKTLKITL